MKRVLPILGALALPIGALACGGPFEEAPPTLPYYLDRLPAKPAAVIFDEAYGAPTAADHPVDFKAALLSLAGDCDADRPAAALLGATDQLLARARLDPRRAATLCNLLNDVRDLFSATPAVTGKVAAGYIRWRVEHAIWFRLDWNAKPRSPVYEYYEDQNALQARQQEARQTLEKLAADPAAGPLRVHYLYLLGALAFPAGGQAEFQQVVDEYGEHPRAEAALFMFARCRLAASLSHHDAYGAVLPADAAAATQDRKEAEALFEQYLKRYPQGRFAADVPGWQGALAFDDGDIERALDFYLQQADAPGHPEVLKSAAFMCERCLRSLAAAGDRAPLQKVAAHPRLAMSLIYLLVNAPTAYKGDFEDETPESVNRWRRALLPRLAAAVAEQKEAYKSADWQPRYLALLAQAASGDGDQEQALALCDLGKDQLAKSDDLAFAKLVALARARKLPEAIAAGREFAQAFPKSPLAPGAALRVALALVDNHQAGDALGEISKLESEWTAKDEAYDKAGEDGLDNGMYPSADGNISAGRSALHSDITGAEIQQLKQIDDAILNFAPLPELAAVATGAENADAANLRAVLVERWLAEGENFAEAKKYATPAQWSVAAADLEKLSDDAKGTASDYERLADGWAAARGKLLFAPLETDGTRHLYGDDYGAAADLRRRENGLALGFPADVINHALSSRDEWQHAFAWHLKAADAAPVHSPAEAHSLWAALRMMPAIALVSPFTFQYAGETGASGVSRQLYTRLRQDCPASREARELAVYYDLAPQPHDPGARPDYSPAEGHEYIESQEPEYRYSSSSEGFGNAGADVPKAVTEDALALRAPDLARDPQRMAQEVADMRSRLNAVPKDRSDYFLANFLDDLADFLQEPASELTAPAITRYVQLRTECMAVEHWGWNGIRLPAVPNVVSGTDLNDAVRSHIAAARADLEMASFYDYLDFLAMAVVANENIDIPVPGETQEDKDGPDGAREPVTYASRDYPKLAKMAEDFLAAYPHSRKREAALLLRARALYCAQRPQLRVKEAAWPETGHFASGRIYVADRQQPFEPGEIAAALDASDHEFPKGRYASEIRNLRGLLAWRMHDWPRALDLTFQSLADPSDPVLQRDAAHRLTNLFADGLGDDEERARCLAAIKANPDAAQSLRNFLPASPYPVRAMQTWILAQL